MKIDGREGARGWARMNEWLCWGAYVDFDLAEPFTQCFLVLGREVLVAEEDDASLGDEQSQLVFLLFRQVLELETLDFGADVGGEIGDFGRGRQEGLFLLVGARARVRVWTVLVSDLVGIAVVVTVLVLCVLFGSMFCTHSRNRGREGRYGYPLLRSMPAFLSRMAAGSGMPRSSLMGSATSTMSGMMGAGAMLGTQVGMSIMGVFWW